MTMTREQALAQLFRVALEMQDRSWTPAEAGEVHHWAGELMASHEAIAAMGGGDAFVVAGWIDEQDAERLLNKGPRFVSRVVEVWGVEAPGVRRQTEVVRHVPIYLPPSPQGETK